MLTFHGRNHAPIPRHGRNRPSPRRHSQDRGQPRRCARRQLLREQLLAAGLYERLTLEAFQSGLSWLTILRKRENFRAAFAGFDIAPGTPRDAVIARMGQPYRVVRHAGGERLQYSMQPYGRVAVAHLVGRDVGMVRRDRQPEQAAGIFRLGGARVAEDVDLGAMLLEVNDEWQLQHRYMGIEAMGEMLRPVATNETLQLPSRSA